MQAVTMYHVLFFLLWFVGAGGGRICGCFGAVAGALGHYQVEVVVVPCLEN